MTRIGASIAALLLLLLPAAAQAVDPRLVPDVSSRSIEIQYSFTGEELLLFGAILYPGQRLPDDRADIVVVLKGPVRPGVLREKQRIAGMWVNASSIRLRTSPGFYAIGSSRPVDKLVNERRYSALPTAAGEAWKPGPSLLSPNSLNSPSAAITVTSPFIFEK